MCPSKSQVTGDKRCVLRPPRRSTGVLQCLCLQPPCAHWQWQPPEQDDVGARPLLHSCTRRHHGDTHGHQGSICGSASRSATCTEGCIGGLVHGNDWCVLEGQQPLACGGPLYPRVQVDVDHLLYRRIRHSVSVTCARARAWIITSGPPPASEYPGPVLPMFALNWYGTSVPLPHSENGKMGTAAPIYGSQRGRAHKPAPQCPKPAPWRPEPEPAVSLP